MHVVLFTSGSGGDILPFIRVGGALRRRGHEVTLATHAGYSELARNAGLQYLALDSSAQYQDFLANASALNTPAGIGKFLKSHSLPFAAAATAAMEATVDADTVILSCPTFDVAPRLTAERTGVGLMWLFIAPVQVTAWAVRKTIRDAMYRGLLGEEINAIRRQLDMPLVADWNQWLSYSEPSIGQWAGWFAEPDDTWLSGVTPIGFLLDDAAERQDIGSPLADFLQRHKKPVLVTGGTGDYLGREFFSTAMKAVEKNQLPAVVVTQYPENLPAALPSSVLVIDRVPFGQLIPHCGAVIHHGGLGTLGAAVSASCPQLILAFGADRPDNGQRATAAGIGEFIDVNQWDGARAAAALDRVYHDKQMFERCVQISRNIIAADAADAATRVVEQFAGNTITKRNGGEAI